MSCKFHPHSSYFPFFQLIRSNCFLCFFSLFQNGGQLIIFLKRLDSQAKRARMSTSPEGITRENNPARSSSSEPINQETISSSPPQTTITRVSKPKVFTRPLIGKHCISLTGCDRGRRVYLSLNKDDTLEANKVRSLCILNILNFMYSNSSLRKESRISIKYLMNGIIIAGLWKANSLY